MGSNHNTITSPPETTPQWIVELVVIVVVAFVFVIVIGLLQSDSVLECGVMFNYGFDGQVSFLDVKSHVVAIVVFLGNFLGIKNQSANIPNNIWTQISKSFSTCNNYRNSLFNPLFKSTSSCQC